jgi:hypothetical protein
MSTSSQRQHISNNEGVHKLTQISIADLISQLKQTDEYTRSKAIADSITFLLSHINSLETSNTSLKEEINSLTSSSSELNLNLTKLKSDYTLLQNELKLYKSKLSVTEQLNHTLEQTIKELNSKLSNQQRNFDSKCDKFSSILSEYKNIFETLKEEKNTLDIELNTALDKLNQFQQENVKLRQDNSLLMNEQGKYNLMQKKIKDYELLLYKIDLENQTFKQELKKYQHLNMKTGQIGNQCETIDNLKKIDLNSELNTIENDYKDNVVGTAVNLVTETDTNNNYINGTNNMFISEDNNINNNNNVVVNESLVNLAELTREIKQTENTLKEYSTLLLEKEKNKNNNNLEMKTNSQDFKEIMAVMENQTEKLINLKKKYNQLIKTSIA